MHPRFGMAMIHELLLALSGNVGGLVVESEEGFVLNGDADFLSDTEKRAIEKTVRAGFHCKRLADFTTAVRRKHLDVGSSKACTSRSKGGSGSACMGGVAASHYLYGAALRVDALLDKYRDRVVVLEAHVLKEPSLPLAYLATQVDDDRRVLFAVHRLVDRVMKDGLRGAKLLDLLYNAAADNMASGSVHEALWQVVSGIGQVLVNQLVSWMIHGRLADPCAEFFVGRAMDQQPGWTFASALRGGPVDDLSKEVSATLAQREWHNLFFLRPEAVPLSVMTIETARKVLFVGKAVRVLLRSGRWIPHMGGTALSSQSARVQEEVDALRACFFAKSPVYIVEQGVERVRSSVAMQLRQLVVEEAGLVSHLAALKGFYLLGYGPFYQTFLEAARPLLHRPPSTHAELELVHGPWAAAMADVDVASDLASSMPPMPATRTTPTAANANAPVTAAAAALAAAAIADATEELPGMPRKSISEKALASRFSIRCVPRQFDFPSFVEAARQVKLVGMARITNGHVELCLGHSTGQPAASGAGQAAMMWLATRQRVAHSFDQAFTFQVHAPPTTSQSLHTPEYGCRFALCFQNQYVPGAIQRWAAGEAGGGIGSAKPNQCASWTSLGECLALEVVYRTIPSTSGADPSAEVSLQLYVCHPGLWDFGRSAGAAGAAPDGDAKGVASSGNSACNSLGSVGLESAAVQCLASATTHTPVRRGAVHLVRLWHDEAARQLQVFFGADAVAPACAAELDIGTMLSLDLGCAFMGFCALPLGHQHQIVACASEGGQRGTASSVSGATAGLAKGGVKSAGDVPLYTARDRPLSIVSWRHRTHTAAHTASQGIAGAVRDAASAPHVEDQGSTNLWFSTTELSYDVPWPLPLVITRFALEKYNRIFQLLFSFRHVHLELQRQTLPRGEVLAWAFRAQLSFFVSQVLLYFQQDVIEVEHQKLVQAVEESRDFDDVVGAHEAFLATISAHCFLQSPDLSKYLASSLQKAAFFCKLNASRRQPDGAAGRDMRIDSELRRLQAEFAGTVQSVLRLMSSMRQHGMHTHLSQLLLRLDYNGYFSGNGTSASDVMPDGGATSASAAAARRLEATGGLAAGAEGMRPAGRGTGPGVAPSAAPGVWSWDPGAGADTPAAHGFQGNARWSWGDLLQ